MISRRLDIKGLALLWRYYQIGIINTLVGFCLYVGFVRIGLNLYVAQIISHLLGMSFNYLTYSRHVFTGSAPAKKRFVAAYGVNYVVSLGSLMLASQFVRSPYAAGAISIIIASLINYFVLRNFVFRAPQT